MTVADLRDVVEQIKASAVPFSEHDFYEVEVPISVVRQCRRMIEKDVLCACCRRALLHCECTDEELIAHANRQVKIRYVEMGE